MKLIMLAAVSAAFLMSSAAVASAATEKKEEKMRCKRVTETGSLAKVSRVCRTEREWRAIREQAQQDTSRAQEGGRMNSSPQ